MPLLSIANQIPTGLPVFAILSDDYFSVPEEQIKSLEAVLTVVDGKVVYGAEDYKNMNPPLPTVIPEWSPIKYYGGFQNK